MNTSSISGMYRIIRPREYTSSLIHVVDMLSLPEELSYDSDLLAEGDTAMLLISANVRRVSFEVLSGPGVDTASVLVSVLPKSDMVIRMRGVHDSMRGKNVSVIVEPESTFQLEKHFDLQDVRQITKMRACMRDEFPESHQIGLFPTISMSKEELNG